MKKHNFVSDPLGNSCVIQEKGSEAFTIFIIKRDNVPKKEQLKLQEPKINVPKDEEIFRHVKFLNKRDFHV